MGSLLLTIVSDSHLSSRTPEATENWNALLEHIATVGPDAVVHTGDISLDGASSNADLEHSRACLAQVSAPLLTLPGNHDLGDNPCETNVGSEHLVDSARLADYREIIGEDRWRVDIGNWRLIGCNAQLFDSGMDEETEQWDWLESELVPGVSNGRPIAAFLHKPLLHSDPHPAEHDVPIRYVREGSRQRFLDLLERTGVRVVVSGHVHQHHRVEARGMDHIWAPTSWATLAETTQPSVGEKWVGALDMRLSDDGSIEIDRIQPNQVTQHIIGETIANPYDHH